MHYDWQESKKKTNYSLGLLFKFEFCWVAKMQKKYCGNFIKKRRYFTENWECWVFQEYWQYTI